MNVILAKVKERLKSPTNQKKFTSFVHYKEIPYQIGAKAVEVASSMNTELLRESLNYLIEK